MMMPVENALARILAYMAENIINAAFEAKDVSNIALEAIMVEELGYTSQKTTSKSQRLYYIYKEEPLEFEKDLRDNG